MVKKKLLAAMALAAMLVCVFTGGSALAAADIAGEVDGNTDIRVLEDESVEKLAEEYIDSTVGEAEPAAPTLDNYHDPSCGDCQTIENGIYSIKLKNSNYYVDVEWGVDKNGTRVHSWPLNYTFSQLWIVKSMGNGEYVILNMMGSKSLEIEKSYTHSGARVQIWNYSDIPTMRWRIEPVRDRFGNHVKNTHKLVNVNSNLRLDILHGRQVQQNPFHAWVNADVPSQNYELILRQRLDD